MITATTIRQQESQSGGHRRAPVIALTANAMEDDRTRCLAADMDDYLAKPFTVAPLNTIPHAMPDTDHGRHRSSIQPLANHNA